jgi:hypothetical protein
MDNKKADLSMNMIIVAALALLVLVVVSLIFISRTNIFSRSAKNCEENGGTCVDRYTTCQDALERDPDYKGSYDTVRQRSDLACLDSSGKAVKGRICCQFI